MLKGLPELPMTDAVFCRQMLDVLFKMQRTGEVLTASARHVLEFSGENILPADRRHLSELEGNYKELKARGALMREADHPFNTPMYRLAQNIRPNGDSFRSGPLDLLRRLGFLGA